MTKTGNGRLIKVLLILSLILNGIAAAYVVKKIYWKSQRGAYTPPLKRAYYLDRNKLFEVLPKDSNAIVFLGNSLTQYFELAELLQNPAVKNRGIHGDMLEGVLKRLTPIIQSRPKKIFIEIGINDLEQGHTKEQLASEYFRLADTLRTSCPQAKIYLQSLLPVADSSIWLPSYCSPNINREVAEVNKILKDYAVKNNYAFIDTHKEFLSDHELNAMYSVDGVHLSGEGYLLWAKIVKPYVDE